MYRSPLNSISVSASMLVLVLTPRLLRCGSRIFSLGVSPAHPPAVSGMLRRLGGFTRPHARLARQL